MESGRVTESRAPGLPVGTPVAAAYGHATGYVADPNTEHVVPLPADLDPVLGVYVAHMGPICANGLLHAAAEACGTDVRTLGDGVSGRRVAIVGGGVVGLLTGLLPPARRRGRGRPVDRHRDAAPRRRLGLDALDPDATTGRGAQERWRHAPADRGADVVFQCRGRTAALAMALRLLRPQGIVIDLASTPTTAAPSGSAPSSTTTGWGSAVPRSDVSPGDRPQLGPGTALGESCGCCSTKDHGSPARITDFVPLTKPRSLRPRGSPPAHDPGRHHPQRER